MAPAGAVPAFLEGGGDMGALVRAHPWGRTALGPSSDWPDSLKSALGLCLDSAFPIAIYWGEDLALLYNDAWRPILGDKHPWALGRPAHEVWPEIWDAIDPVFRQVRATGKAAFRHDGLLAMNRFGYTEECYFDYTLNPIRLRLDVAGIFNVVIETTYRVIGERRARAQRDFAARLAPAKSIDDVMAFAAASLGEEAADVPFALLYRVGRDGSAYLEQAIGVRPGSAAAPRRLALEGPQRSWPLGEVARSGAVVHVEQLTDLFGEPLPGGPWPEPAREALVLPVSAGGERSPIALLVAGVSPRRALDLEYRSFFESLGAHLGRAIGNAAAYETERKRAEALAELDRAKTAFFSNISHEFRTPLTLMLGPVEELLEKTAGQLSPADREALSAVQRNGRRLLKLVNTLLDFARIEAGRAQASYEPTDLPAFTAELASNFRSACERAGLALQIECSPAAEPAYVDREMWETIVLNLVSNAFKFTLSGSISVELDSSQDGFELRVRDSGTGIPAAELPRMFERFHRIEGARGRSHEGSGIGLALVHELVKLHGGTIGVESELGRGSTFVVRIPSGAAHLPAERVKPRRASASRVPRAETYVEEAMRWLPEPERAAGTAGRNLPRVLLADDNVDLRAYTYRLLAETYDVETVVDGEAALAAARARKPDLVVSDIMMPKLDGFGLLAALRADERLRDVPVILLSGRAGEEARLQGLGKGADDYLVKPFSARELLVRAGTLLRSAELRREAEKQLRDSEARYRAVVDSQTELVCRFRPDGEILFVNAAYARSVGSTVEAMRARNFWDFVAADDRPRVRALLETLTRDAPELRIENRFDTNDGERWMLWTNRALAFDAAGRVSEAQSTGVDITDRKRAELALAEADRRKDEFIATLSHELRNPLAPLRNGLHLLRLSGGGDQRLAPVHQMMERQVDHLVRLVDDLLEISRITRGVLELRRQRVELAAIVANAMDTAETLVQAAGHRLDVLLPSEPLQLDGDPVRLGQILANLLNNAANYTPRGGRIELRAQREGEQVVISVRDDGHGIAPEQLERVFDMFNRGERSSGLGIGLALARRLAEMHGGTIRAESAGPAQGSTFIVTLPLADGRATTTEAAAPEAVALPQKRVLVVDDNHDAANSLAMLLQYLGADVDVAHNGHEALERFQAATPAVVLLDIGMPEMDGYEVARAIRARETDGRVPLVALTGWGQEEDRRRAREAGFDHHLVKPADIDALKALLAAL
jgi:PAS domain S-box-containing protein